MTQATSWREWSFWKKRVARVLLVGGVVLAAQYFSNQMAQKQELILVAPGDYQVERVHVLLTRQGADEIYRGIDQVNANKENRMGLFPQLPPGEYQVEIAVQLRTPKEQSS
ncbi:MAG: hypothetical protein MK135_09380 [Polyangiaceae bacterium]|nr:hypothetical protein [Polyangiaceae bacterium]